MKKIIIISLVFALIILVSCNNTSKDAHSVKQIEITKTNEYLNLISPKDKLLFNMSDSYLLCTKDNEHEITLEEYVRNYQAFLSDSGNTVFYNTNSANEKGKLKCYHIDKNESGGLLEDMGIEIDGYVSLISYKSDKILVLCGDSSEQIRKTEANILMEIDLKNETYRKTELPFTPSGAWVYNGLAYFGDNIGILCSYKELKNTNQVLVILDKEGNILEETEIHEKDTMCNISPSPDVSKFTYQTGTSPVDLKLYDLKNKTSKTLFSSEDAICISSAWGQNSGNLYYITYEDNSNKYTLHVLEKDEL